VNLRTRPAPAPPSGLYDVSWRDAKGSHVDRGLTWDQACAEWCDCCHIVGRYEVRIVAQGGAG
jgi:hypothetical protein